MSMMEVADKIEALADLLERVSEQDIDATVLQWQRHGLAAEVQRAGLDLPVLLALARLRALSPEQEDRLRLYRRLLTPGFVRHLRQEQEGQS